MSLCNVFVIRDQKTLHNTSNITPEDSQSHLPDNGHSMTLTLTLSPGSYSWVYGFLNCKHTFSITSEDNSNQIKVIV